MLAIVESTRSIRGAVQYNEQKVKQSQALFLDAHNFLQEKEELTIRDKLQRFRDLTILNERSVKHGIHISVNFPPKDELSDKQMTRIAADFMRSIGFEDQPWLLYRHTDVGHPHMHIVTTNIRPDGSRIKNDLRSPHHLKQVCFEVEERYHLTPIYEMPDLFGMKAPVAQKQEYDKYGPPRITYGEKPTRSAIAEVLEYVNREYAFTSFDAYNAVLNAWNIRADRGREDRPMYQSRGLYYRIIDENGRKLGAPVKASAFHLPVTLGRLEEKFQLSQQRVRESIYRTQSTVNYVLAGQNQPYSVYLFAEDLRRQQVWLLVSAQRHRNQRGWERRVAGILDTQKIEGQKPAIKPDDGHGFFYIDSRTKIVCRDTELGENFTAAAILQYTGIEQEILRMIRENVFKLSNTEKQILSPGYPDTAETRRLLLKLSPSQSYAVKQELELKQKQELAQRQQHRMRHSL